MSVDDMILRDPRVVRLAKVLPALAMLDIDAEWGRRAARGLLLEIWAVCYDRRTPSMAPEDVDMIGGDGTANALVACDLARAEAGMIRISGAEERIRYLVNLSTNAANGGKKSGEARRSQRSNRRDLFPNTNEPHGSENEPHGSEKGTARLKKSNRATNPLVPDPVPVPDPSSAPAPAPDQGARGRAVRGAAHPAYPGLVDAWFDGFAAAHEGAKPTWAGREGKALNELLSRHPAEEIARRMRIAFDHPRAFPPQPWSFTVFAQRFDECATAPRTPAAPSATRESPVRQMLRETRELDKPRDRPPWEDGEP